MQKMATGSVAAAMTGMILLAMLTTTAQAGNTTLVKWEVTQTSCEMSTNPPVTLPLGDVDVTGIEKRSYLYKGGQKLQILIDNCDGISPGNGTRPVVTVHGGLATVPGFPSNTWLFKSGGDSEQLYIVLRKDTKPGGTNSTDYEVRDGEGIYFSGLLANSAPQPGQKYSVDLTAVVECGLVDQGTPLMCSQMRAGSLSASFTFNFEYK